MVRPTQRSSTGRTDPSHIAPFLTHEVSHHGQITLVPPQNAGRVRKSKPKSARPERRREAEEPRFNVSIPSTRRSHTTSPRIQGQHRSSPRISRDPDIPDYPPPSFQEAISTPPLIQSAASDPSISHQLSQSSAAQDAAVSTELGSEAQSAEFESPSSAHGEASELSRDGTRETFLQPNRQSPSRLVNPTSYYLPPQASTSSSSIAIPLTPPPSPISQDLRSIAGNRGSTSEDSDIEVVPRGPLALSWEADTQLGLPLEDRVQREYLRQVAAESTVALVETPRANLSELPNSSSPSFNHSLGTNDKQPRCVKGRVLQPLRFTGGEDNSPSSARNSPPSDRSMWPRSFSPTSDRDISSGPSSPTTAGPMTPASLSSTPWGSSVTLPPGNVSLSPKSSQPSLRKGMKRKESVVFRKLFKGKEREHSPPSEESIDTWEVVDDPDLPSPSQHCNKPRETDALDEVHSVASALHHDPHAFLNRPVRSNHAWSPHRLLSPSRATLNSPSQASLSSPSRWTLNSPSHIALTSPSRVTLTPTLSTDSPTSPSESVSEAQSEKPRRRPPPPPPTRTHKPSLSTSPSVIWRTPGSQSISSVSPTLSTSVSSDSASFSPHSPLHISRPPVPPPSLPVSSSKQRAHTSLPTLTVNASHSNLFNHYISSSSDQESPFPTPTSSNSTSSVHKSTAHASHLSTQELGSHHSERFSSPMIMRPPRRLVSPSVSSMSSLRFASPPDTPTTPTRHYRGRPLPQPPQEHSPLGEPIYVPPSSPHSSARPTTHRSSSSPLRNLSTSSSHSAESTISLDDTAASPTPSINPESMSYMTDLDVLVSRLEEGIEDGTNYENLLLLQEIIGSASPPSNKALSNSTSTANSTTELSAVDRPQSPSTPLIGVAIDKCGICLSQFRENDVGGMGVTCRHAFHERCLCKWILQSRSCPLCRHPLDGS
ncbi:hypothetical protein ABKN59_010973 [Abortiporus biennis]